MAKKINTDEFPTNTSMPARLRAVLNALSEARAALGYVSEFAFEHMPEGRIKEIVSNSVKEAIEKLNIAQQASSGE